MPFSIIRDNIVTVSVEAIVNAANNQLRAGGGVCGAIFEAAGKEALQKECNKIGFCKTGEAVLTKGYGLKASYIIHTVGPVWKDGMQGEEQLLRNCYRSSLKLAARKRIKSIAFPLISSGIYGYPKEQALQIAIEEIKAFLKQDKGDMQVMLVIFDQKAFQIGQQRHLKIQEYIDDRYVEPFERRWARRRENEGILKSSMPSADSVIPLQESKPIARKALKKFEKKSLEDCLSRIEETFSQRLLRMIDESGRKDSEVYKKANIDRKHFSKIRSNPDYMPSKKTVIAFAIALELDLDNAKDLLSSAGYTLSRSNKFDIIIEYYLENEIYDIFEINEVLFAFEQPILN